MLQWTTTFEWKGTSDSGVKAYPNLQLDEGLGGQIGSISSMPVRDESETPFGALIRIIL